MTIKQVKKDEGLTLDGQLSRSNHIVVSKVVVKVCERYVCYKKMDCVYDTKLNCTGHSGSGLLAHLDYCPVIWSGAAKKDPARLQLTQTAALLALKCTHRTNINIRHDSLSWLRVKEKLITSLLVFLRNICVCMYPRKSSATANGDSHKQMNKYSQ